MKKEIKRNDLYSLASISVNESKTVSAIITIDIHDKKTVAKEALELIYPEALLAGTKKKSKDEFLNAVNLLGATIGIDASGGIVTISLKSTSAAFSKLLKLVSEMLLMPAFSKKEVDRIKTIVKNELHEAREDSQSRAYDQFLSVLYKEGDRKHSFGLEELDKAIKKITPTEISQMHKALSERHWHCSIAGTETHIKKFEITLKKLRKSHKTAEIQNQFHELKPIKKGVVTLQNIPSRQNIDFSIGCSVPFTLHHPDYIPLSFGLSVLAKWGGFAGRLMSTVREKEGLTYGIYGRLNGFTGTEQGYWRIMTFFAPNQAEQGLKSTFREIDKIHKKGITKEELTRFKIIISTGQALLNDSITGQLRDLHNHSCHGFSLKEIKERKNKIKNIKLNEVNEALKKYLNPDKVVVSGAGPITHHKKSLEKFFKTKKAN